MQLHFLLSFTYYAYIILLHITHTYFYFMSCFYCQFASSQYLHAQGKGWTMSVDGDVDYGHEFPAHYKVMLDKLNEQRQLDQFTDITLIVDGEVSFS